MILAAIALFLTVSFSLSAGVVGVATYHTLKARDIDAGIVGIVATAGMVGCAVAALSILVTL